MYASVWSNASGAVSDAIDSIERWVSGFSAIDFILAVAVVWSVYWIVSVLRAATRLGPVEVSLLEHDAKDDASTPDVHALTGRFRERLASGGLLPPPSVPAGSPQTNLIAAVESSGHPQAAWVAKALELIPRPPRSPEYRLSGTLLKANDGAMAPRLRYWLRPVTTGPPLLESASGSSEEEAICRAASEIVIDISRDAVHVFPQWALWSDCEAFKTYVDGIEATFASNDALAEECFQAAVAAQPANLLPRIQLANLLEKQAGMNGAGDVWATAQAQARSLRGYLDIGVARSDVVAARYRAGVAAGMLATACEVPFGPLPEATDTALKAVAEEIGLRQKDGTAFPPHGIAVALHDLAAAEIHDAHELVGRFQVLFDKRRLRHRYEPTGIDRRRLRRSIAISKHTLRIRRLRNDESDEAKRELLRRRLLVDWLHLGLFRASAGWNAHYNAGCFFALLYDRELKVLKAETTAVLEAGNA